VRRHAPGDAEALVAALCIIDRSSGAHQLGDAELQLLSLFTANDLG